MPKDGAEGHAGDGREATRSSEAASKDSYRCNKVGKGGGWRKAQNVENHQIKVEALEGKAEKAVTAAKRHKEARQQAIKDEEERHAKTMKQALMFVHRAWWLGDQISGLRVF